MSAEETNPPESGMPIDLADWLRSIGMDQYAGAFAEQRITLGILPELTDTDLKEMGVAAMGDRKLILREIAALKPGAAAPPQPVPPVHGNAPGLLLGPQSPPMPPPPAVVPPEVPVAQALPGLGRSIASVAEPLSAKLPLTPAAAATRPSQPAVEEVAVAGEKAAARPLAAPQRLWKAMRSNRFLFVSIVAHVIFALVATLLVVQTIVNRKLTFTAAPPSPNPAQRASEHRVQMAQKRKTMSMPVQEKRITTTGFSKVALPDMPAMPGVAAPTKMASAGGAVSFGQGLGGGGIGGGTGTGGGGGAIPFFGFKGRGDGLVGTFYDLKQTTSRQPTKMTTQLYSKEITRFLKEDWRPEYFTRFYKAPTLLTATKIFMPDMKASICPAAFGVEKEVQPCMWIALYKGKVAPPANSRFHFVGHGDDLLMVKFDGKLVLAANWDTQEVIKRFGKVETNFKPEAEFRNGWPSGSYPIPPWRKGPAIEVRAGVFYPMEVLIGELPGGRGHAVLMIEEEGVEYKKDAKGNPILPVFRLADTPIPPLEKDESYPPHAEGGPVWRGKN